MESQTSFDRDLVVWTLSDFGSSVPKPAASDRRRHARIEIPRSRRGLAHAARTALTSAPLLASDLVALMLALTLAHGMLGFPELPAAAGILPTFALLAIGLVVANAAFDLYPGVGLHGVIELRQSATAVFLIFGAVALAELFRGGSLVLVLILLLAGGAAAMAIPVLRMLTRWVFSRFPWWSHPMLVIGPRPAVGQIVSYFEAHPGLGLRPIPVHSEGGDSPQLSTVSILAREHEATCAALAVGGGDPIADSFLVRYCASLFPSLLIVPEPSILPNLWTRSTDVGGMVGIQTGASLHQPMSRALKRTLDLTLATCMGALSLPLLVGIAVIVKLTSPGPVFYGQQRVGRGRRPFKAWKFRTMYADADQVLQECLASDLSLRREWARDHKLRNDPRITPVGRILRKTSLDELPQLWNIIRGDMSLVGPRPVVTQEIPKYGQEFGYYLSVPPGLTGLWQVSGRSRTTYEERVALDTFYVQNWSIWLDLYILARTVRAVVTADGAC